MSNERRVIGYDAGTGGDGSPVYERGDAGGLPEGWEWRAADGIAGCLFLWAPGVSGHDMQSATAHTTGRWRAYQTPDAPSSFAGFIATPHPGETPLAAAQREAEAALWRVDGFGVGEVRGVTVPAPQQGTIVVGARVSFPGLSGLWRVTATHYRADVAETVDAVKVDARPAGEVGPLSLVSPEVARIHRAMGSTPIVDPDEVFGRKLRVYPHDPMIVPVAAPQSEGTVASEPALFASVSPEVFAALPRPSRAEIQAALDAGRPPSLRPVANATSEPAITPAPAPGDELARLLPGLAEDAGTARRLGHVYSPTVARVARAAELLLAERDRLAREVAAAEERADAWANRAAEGIATIKALRARVAELEAELADLTARHGETMAAFYSAAPEGASALGRRQVEAQSIDSTLGPEEAARLRAELTKQPARPDRNADAMALTLAAEQSIRNWLRAHGHDTDRPWDEVVIGLLSAPPVGSVARLLAWTKQARKDARADRGPHLKGQVAALYAAESAIRSALAPSPMGTRCDTCREFGSRVSPDGRLTYLWGEEEEEQYLSTEQSAEVARLIYERQGLTVPQESALDAKARAIVEEVMAIRVEDGEPIDFANDIHCEVDKMSTVGGETRENFTRIAALAIRGVLACDAKGGA